MNPFLGDDRAESPTWLYRYYDADGDPLYIGISNEPKTRMFRHVSTQWYLSAVAVFYECFPMRRLAECAEKIAIRTEGPIYNVVRRYSDRVSAHDCDWYFDLTGDVLAGQGKFWTSPRDASLAPTDRPPFLSDPDPLTPEITNRNCRR